MKDCLLNTERCALGVELGSTRIKAVLVDEAGRTLAHGEYDWENQFKDGLWTYSLEDAVKGLQTAYARTKANVKEQYGVTIKKLGGIGISAMMHGYLVFGKEGEQLVPFRTWRNNNAAEAAVRLTHLFGYPIPARWSVAHLYQAILDGEEHVFRIARQTTLAGYIHGILTGENVVGIDEASGMFPIDSKTKDFDTGMLAVFDDILRLQGISWRMRDILPGVLSAGQCAGRLTAAGAALLDVEGDLGSGCPFAPPEGDAATGMVATNSLKPRTGNVSAGTSIFGMIVLEHPLKTIHSDVDLVSSPTGDPVAMVHCNNCSSDLNAWFSLFAQFTALDGGNLSGDELYTKLYEASLQGDEDCGGVLVYNYVSGENITKVTAGRPMVIRKTESRFTLPNFLRSGIYSSMMTLKIGLDMLVHEENVGVDSLVGHGGVFRTKGVYQQYLADAVGAPVTVLETTGEGGAWGMALLALYASLGNGADLQTFLDETVFCLQSGTTLFPSSSGMAGMNRYKEEYVRGLEAVRKAVEVL